MLPEAAHRRQSVRGRYSDEAFPSGSGMVLHGLMLSTIVLLYAISVWPG